MTSGYSGTPLARKLSLKDGMRVWFDAMPDSVRDEMPLMASCCPKKRCPRRASTQPTFS